MKLDLEEQLCRNLESVKFHKEIFLVFHPSHPACFIMLFLFSFFDKLTQIYK